MDPGFYFKSRIFPAVLMSFGLVILVSQVAIPLFFFTTQNEVAKPVTSSVLGVASGYSEFEFKELSNKGTVGTKISLNAPTYFYITIPRLNIEKAKVEANSTNLSPDAFLGHYRGSSLPGEVGNAFIYGHSVLPVFYNPKNYRTIFSTLDKLETGDEFYIDYGNNKYTYKVEDKKVVSPDAVKPLAEIKPKYLNESTMVLMTCWPAGTK
ncbi:hypothetical protein A3K42_01555, partial [candidate division WWE3 bacterium RBG_13_37_7]